MGGEDGYKRQVQCLTFHDGVTDTHLKILKLRPQVQLRVGQHRVKVSGFSGAYP